MADTFLGGGNAPDLGAACLLLGELPAPLPAPLVLVLHRSQASDAGRVTTSS